MTSSSHGMEPGQNGPMLERADTYRARAEACSREATEETLPNVALRKRGEAVAWLKLANLADRMERRENPRPAPARRSI